MASQKAPVPRISRLAQALEISNEARVITQGQAPFRIVHTNKAWHDITGYRFAEVFNMSSAFMQGPGTDRASERALVNACRQGQHVKVRLLNYNKAGAPFFNILECFPLRDTRGTLTHFCGVMVAEPAGNDYPHRVVAPFVQPPVRVQHDPEADDMPHNSGGHYQQLGSSSSSNDGDGVSRRSSVDTQKCVEVVHEEPREQPRRNMKRMRGGKATSLGDAMNNSSDAVVLTEPKYPYKITHVNQPWVVMCGYTQEEVEGLPNSILQGPETDQAILEDLMSSVRRGEPTSATLVNYKKDGSKFLNQVQVMPIVNEDDELEQFMAILNEVDAPLSSVGGSNAPMPTI